MTLPKYIQENNTLVNLNSMFSCKQPIFQHITCDKNGLHHTVHEKHDCRFMFWGKQQQMWRVLLIVVKKLDWKCLMIQVSLVDNMLNPSSFLQVCETLKWRQRLHIH